MKKWLLSLFLIAVATSGPCLADANTALAAPLVGIRKVRLVLSVPAAADGRRLNFDQSSLRASVEVRLRSAGLAVASGESYLPVLILEVDVMERSQGTLVYTINCNLLDRAVIERGQKRFRPVVGIWSSSIYGFMPESRYEQIITDSILKQVDRFLNLYLITNPRR